MNFSWGLMYPKRVLLQDLLLVKTIFFKKLFYVGYLSTQNFYICNSSRIEQTSSKNGFFCIQICLLLTPLLRFTIILDVNIRTQYTFLLGVHVSQEDATVLLLLKTVYLAKDYFCNRCFLSNPELLYLYYSSNMKHTSCKNGFFCIQIYLLLTPLLQFSRILDIGRRTQYKFLLGVDVSQEDVSASTPVEDCIFAKKLLFR